MDRTAENMTITLNHGAGGKVMDDLIRRIAATLQIENKWEGSDDDGAALAMADGRYLVMTTDSHIVNPIFFPGGDIGKLSVCGTLNDLAVMGAEPLGLSFALILEEGFCMQDLDRIILSMKETLNKAGVPVVTGDTKVMPKGTMDGIIINTTGIGTAGRLLRNNRIEAGDAILISGSIGDHGA